MPSKTKCIVDAFNYVPSTVFVIFCTNLIIQYIIGIIRCKYNTNFSLLLNFCVALFLNLCAFSLLGIFTNLENLLSPLCCTDSNHSSSLSLTSLITHNEVFVTHINDEDDFSFSLYVFLYFISQ